MDELRVQAEFERLLGIVRAQGAQIRTRYEQLARRVACAMSGGPEVTYADVDARTRLVRVQFRIELDPARPQAPLTQLHIQIRQAEPIFQAYPRRQFFADLPPQVQPVGPVLEVTCAARGVLERY
jgi:hypothetical protein